MLERSELELGTELGSGGQGRVLEIVNLVWPNAPSEAEIEGLVYKRYHPETVKDIDIAALESMPTFLEHLSPAGRVSMLRSVAWPLTTVRHEGELTGFIMPRIVRAFLFDRRLAKGTIKPTVATAQFLMNSHAQLKRMGVEVDGRERCAILADLANGVAFLHEHDIVVGDISPTNVLWSKAPTCRAFLIDADSMAVRGRSATVRVETPDWDAPTSADGTSSDSPADDNYKLGLMALRLLTGSMHTRDPDLLAPGLSATREMVRASLSAKPDERPDARQWTSHLRELAQDTVKLPWLDEPPVGASAAATPTTPTRRPGSSQASSVGECPAAPMPARDMAVAASRTGTVRAPARRQQPRPTHRIPQERPLRPGSNGEPESPRRRAAGRGVAVALGIATAWLLVAALLLLWAALRDGEADDAEQSSSAADAQQSHRVVDAWRMTSRPAAAWPCPPLDDGNHAVAHHLASRSCGAGNPSNHHEWRNTQ